jgi:serine phosphatase RsbU (regulator of sigma subunit)
MFATCAVVHLPARTDSGEHFFEYSLAGHPPPALFSADGGAIKRLEEGPAVLGVLPSAEFYSHKCEVRAGDLLFIFTDGLVEISNPQGEEFGWSRLQAVVEQNQSRSLKDIAKAIFEDSARWGTAMDDRTLLFVRFR